MRMKLSNMKLFIGVFLLLAYMSIGVFGLLQFAHMNNMPMADCLYSENSYSICDNGLTHINNWHQFSDLILSSLLILGIVLYFFSKHNFLNQKQHFYKWKYYLNNKLSYLFQRRIIKWLSLLENSPSFSVVRFF